MSKRKRGERLFATEVAERAGISPATLRSYINRGQIPPPDGQVGRFNFWFEATLAEWFARPRTPGRPSPTTTKEHQ